MKPCLGTLIAAAAFAVTLAGCDSQPYQVAPVSGRVTLDDEPLPEALVTFQPIGGAEAKEPGPGSFGRTDKDGRFTLRIVEPDQPGAVVGLHQVFISTATSAGGDGDRILGERVPRRYRDGKLQFEVPRGGTTEANFDLRTVEPSKR
jgi:hypothetical protein